MLLITLPGLVMLIVPEIESPATAFQRDSSPLAIHGLSRILPHGNAKSDAIRGLFRASQTTNRVGGASFTCNTVVFPLFRSQSCVARFHDVSANSQVTYR
jgi:hypothetical protein